MWIVAKIKLKNLNTFKKKLSEKMGNDIQFYHPKLEYHKYFGNRVKRFEKFILENYIFCYHEKFKKSSFVNEIKFLKGLEYFLEGYNQNQNNIIKFIEKIISKDWMNIVKIIEKITKKKIKNGIQDSR